MDFDGSELAQAVLIEREEQIEALHLNEVASQAFPTLAKKLVFEAGEAIWSTSNCLAVMTEGSLDVPVSQKEKGVQTMTLRASTELEFKDSTWQMSRSPQIMLQLSFNDDPAIDVATLQPPMLRSDDSGLRDEAGNPFDDEDNEAWVIRLIDEAFMTEPHGTVIVAA